MTTPKPAKGLVRFLQAIGVSVLALSAVRAPLIVALLAAFILALPDQTREIYRVLAAAPEQNRFPIALAFSLLLIVSLMCWYLARNRTIVCRKDDIAKSTSFGHLLRWVPLLCGATIPLGAAVDCHRRRNK
jgi:hypothetical protein